MKSNDDMARTRENVLGIKAQIKPQSIEYVLTFDNASLFIIFNRNIFMETKYIDQDYFSSSITTQNHTNMQRNYHA